MTGLGWPLAVAGFGLLLCAGLVAWRTRPGRVHPEKPRDGATGWGGDGHCCPPARPWSDENPHPGVSGVGRRQKRPEGDFFGVDAGRITHVPTTSDPDHLAAYRAWLTAAQHTAREHAAALSTELASNPDRDDARWCLLHQAIGRATAHRQALDLLPSVAGSGTAYGPDNPPPTVTQILDQQRRKADR